MSLKLEFFKYHGAGNDFIIVDNRDDKIKESDKSNLAKKLCHRNFGIGGDGLLLIENAEQRKGAHAKMRIFNPDGSEAEMCGNGIRCFAHHLAGLISLEKIRIETLAGVKEVEVKKKNSKTYISVDMGYAESIELNKKIKIGMEEISYDFLILGVPHAIVFVDSLDNLDVEQYGRKIRFNKVFESGTNVDFVEKVNSEENEFKIRTYERGVESETLACGTGICASAVIAVLRNLADEREEIKFIAKGGTVYAKVLRKSAEKIKCLMLGPSEFVFKGEIEI